jgi:DNA-binding SARP family transcriptional activator/DNA-binding HxlR family transcriptional regulator
MNLIRSADEEPKDETFRQGRRFSPSRALEAVGDRWSLLIIREALFKGVTRFSEFERRVGVEGDVLAARLDGFVGAGLMRERPVAGQLEETEYVLTPNGRNLEPVIVALSTWADSWAVSPSTERALVGVEALAGTPAPDDVRAGEAVENAAGVVPAEGDRLLIEISLLGSFGLRVDGTRVGSLSVGSQRLLAFLALHDRSVARITMAGAMWPEVSDERAGISLRSALSRLDPATRDAILSASPGLSLAEAVIVDLRDGRALARRLVRATGSPSDADISPAAISLLSLELLPDWYDDWVLAEAEDWRQLRMNALEAAADRLIAAGRLAEASSAARAAIKVEPLRESAHAALIRVHLAEGNQSEALRVFDRYRALITSVLDLEPTPIICSLVAGIRKP